MACEITKGRLLSCKDAIGGIQAIYFFNYGTTSFTLTDDSVTGIVDTVETDLVATAYKYDLKGTGNNLVQNVNSDRNTGTTYFEQILSVTLKKMSASTNKEVKLLAYGNPYIGVHDNAGNMWIVGLVHGADLTGGTIVTGDAFGDLNGYTMTFTGMEQLPANHVTGSTNALPFGAIDVDIVLGT